VNTFELLERQDAWIHTISVFGFRIEKEAFVSEAKRTVSGTPKSLPVIHVTDYSEPSAYPDTGGKKAYCFAASNRVYAIYLPDGGQADLRLEAGTHGIHWYNPREGGRLQAGSVKQIEGPGWRSIGVPPDNSGWDWAALVCVPSFLKGRDK
jgi:hypothetical protein